MKNHTRIELVGTIKSANFQRFDNIRRVKLSVETEDWHEGIKHILPVTVWENEGKFLTIGTTVYIVGKIRVKNQKTAYRAEKTVREVIASQVEIIYAQ